ncbi:MAG: class I SAM-dependent methyltransferase [Pseudomonadota bacterium]|nr:class I SAM-dependent methyltransferase [Pseudomonadota bacterium]
MLDSIFKHRPWASSQKEIEGMPRGMLRVVEGSMLYFLARDYFRGFGEIIDAGAFLGASSFCLAKGLEDNNEIRAKSGRLHAYDLFTVWREQERSDQFMASELKRIFDIDVGTNESTLPIYFANLGPLARHIMVYPGDIMKKQWNSRPIEILFLDICKSKTILQHILSTFYPSLIPGISVVLHQDYHHPLLPFIHVAQERLAPYFQIVEAKADDTAAFLITDRIPEKVLNEVAQYDFTAAEEFKLMDQAIERLAGQNRHLKVAKCQLLRQRGRVAEGRELLEELKQDISNAADDPLFPAYIGFVEANLFRDEARLLGAPEGFDESEYLAANPDVKQAVTLGYFDSGFHHWLQCGRHAGRLLSTPK